MVSLALVVVDEKVCSRCELPRPTSEFWKMKASADGLQNYCKDCSRAVRHWWIMLPGNRQQARESNKRSKHRRRMLSRHG